MTKTTPAHEDTIQFRVPADDKRSFQDAASKMRVSLSAWLRIAGLEKIERERASAAPAKGGKSKPAKAR